MASNKIIKAINKMKREAVRSITFRESLLMQLNALILNWPVNSNEEVDSSHPEASRLLKNV